MNKLFSKIAALSVGLAMAVGVGVAVSHESVREAKAGEVTVSRGASTALSETAENVDSNVTIKTSSANTYTNPNRFYANTTITIETLNNAKLISVVYSASSTGNYVTNAQNATVSPSVTPTVNNKNVTWDLSAVKPSTFTITVTAQTRWTAIGITYEEGSGPSVAFKDLPASLSEGDTGTFEATSTGATSPVYTWTSSDPGILSVDSSTGEYEAVNYGKAELTVSMTCTEGSASKSAFVIVNGAGIMSVSDAVAIAESFDDTVDTVTDYTVLVKGHIVSFDESIKDGKPRAIKISDSKKDSASDTDSILAYGIYSDNPLRSYAIYNGEVTVRAKIENYKGTNELSSLTIEDYTDEAIVYAKNSYESLNEACETGPSAVSDEMWSALANGFINIDSYAKEKLANATSSYEYNEYVAKWLDRYTRLVEAGKDNFMGVTGISSAAFNGAEANNNSYIVIIIIASASVLSFGLALALRKKRTK